jgi:hypothetical protein
MIKDGAGTDLSNAETALCLGAIGRDGMTTRCKETSELVLARKINWSPDGKALLISAASHDGNELGMVQYRSKRAFSSDPADWQSKGFVTDVSKRGEGVLDAVVSPDGKRLAVVALSGDGTTDLFLAKPDDFLLSDAKPLGVRACKVIWRPDGRQLVVVRNDNCLASDTGELIRLPVDDPKDQQSLRLSGDNPTFQPLAAE